MHPVLVVLAKTVSGGVLVMVFAALSEMFTPKRFAGILTAAPSVAIAGLVVGTVAHGGAHEDPAARTMVAGAIAMIAFALVAVLALRRRGLGRTTALGSVAWVAVAAALYAPIA